MKRLFYLVKNWSGKKKVFLCLGCLIFVFFLSLPSPALAFWETLKNAALFVPYLIITLCFVLGILASQAFAWLTGIILDIVMSPSFISISYTQPASNQIIASGLSITQSFVNLILVLVLVYSALSIALRINETEAKKMLSRLIIVALLVNFAPILCGLVVDAANIVMYYFLKPIEEGVSGVLTQIGPHADRVVQTVWGASADLTKRFGVIMMAIAQISLNFAIGLAFLLFAALFLMRYVVIWVLTILSPLAFAFWVLPQTKNLWKMWRDNFVQWSIIGIPAAFFLYLAMGSFSLMTAAFKAKIEMPGMEAPTIGFLNEVFPYFVVVIFLYLGFAIGLQTSAMGAGGVMKLSGGAGKLLRTKIGRGVKNWAEEKIRIPLGKTEEGLPRKIGVKEATGWAVKKWEKAPLARWFIPEAMRQYGEFRPSILEAQKAKEIANVSSQHLGYRLAEGELYGTKGVATVLELIGRGDTTDLFNEFKKKYYTDRNYKDKFKDKKNWSEITDEELFEKVPEFDQKIGRWLQIGLQGGLHNRIIRSSPRLAMGAAGKIPGYMETTMPDGTKRPMTREDAVEKAVSEARNQHIKNWEREDILNPTVVKAGMKRGRDFWQSIFSQVKRGHEDVLKTVSDIFKDYLHGAEPTKANWEKFSEEYTKKGYDGFFQFLRSGRAKEQGWTEGKIIVLAGGKAVSEDEEDKEETTTPGAARGIQAPAGPPETSAGYAAPGVTEKKPATDTGQSKAKKRKEPDTGKL